MSIYLKRLALELYYIRKFSTNWRKENLDRAVMRWRIRLHQSNKETTAWFRLGFVGEFRQLGTNVFEPFGVARRNQKEGMLANTRGIVNKFVETLHQLVPFVLHFEQKHFNLIDILWKRTSFNICHVHMHHGQLDAFQNGIETLNFFT